MADEGQTERNRRDDEQRLVRPAKHRVEEDDQQREQDDGRPTRPERLLEEQQRLLERPAHDPFDGKHQQRRDDQRDDRGDHDARKRPTPPAAKGGRPAPALKASICKREHPRYVFLNKRRLMFTILSRKRHLGVTQNQCLWPNCGRVHNAGKGILGAGCDVLSIASLDSAVRVARHGLRKSQGLGWDDDCVHLSGPGQSGRWNGQGSGRGLSRGEGGVRRGR